MRKCSEPGVSRLGRQRIAAIGMSMRMLALVAFVLMASACSITVPTNHIVMANGLGNPTDPSSNFFGKHLSYVPGVTYRQMDDVRFGEHLYQIRQAMIAHPVEANGKRKVLIFIHGGLNTATDSVARASRLNESIGQAGYFPVFVNWESSFPTSYFDHLFNFRQGRRTFHWCCGNPDAPEPLKTAVGAVVGALTMPFYLATDMARGVLRAPVVWFSLMTKRDQASALSRSASSTFSSLRRRFDSALRDPTGAHPDTVAISEGPDQRNLGERIVTTVDDFNPLKLPASLIIDAGGTSAWANMVRRTRTLFQRDADFERDVGTAQPGGALARWLTHLQETIDQNGGPEAWDVTVVGHSMGAIILNEILRDVPTLPVSSIVYMAAAASIRDYQDTVFPYLLHANTKAEVYHLTLHPDAETEERSFGSIAPDGSLLVWIDAFLSSPATALDLTAGRFTNLLPTLEGTPAPIRERIHVKAFGVGRSLASTDPQAHGDFDTIEFWKPSVWAPEGHHE